MSRQIDVDRQILRSYPDRTILNVIMLAVIITVCVIF